MNNICLLEKFNIYKIAGFMALFAILAYVINYRYKLSIAINHHT